MFKYTWMFILTVLAVCLFAILGWFTAWVCKKYAHVIFPNTYKLHSCPRCNSEQLTLTTVGIIWKLYWFYPLIYFPLFLLIFFISGANPENVLEGSIWYFFIFYVVILFLGLQIGIFPAIVGTLKYQCPSCKEKFFYRHKTIIHPEDLER